jgi:hypothetical protein
MHKSAVQRTREDEHNVRLEAKRRLSVRAEGPVRRRGKVLYAVSVSGGEEGRNVGRETACSGGGDEELDHGQKRARKCQMSEAF